jgi:hypothetical protein
VGTYAAVAELPLAIASCELEPLELSFGKEFTRLTTLVRLRGGGHEGVGEDVTYDGLDHVALQHAGAPLPLSGSYTLDSFSRRLNELELWPSPPVREPSRDYRRWAFESAALDLALRQGGRSLADAVGREPRPLNFVVSMRLVRPARSGQRRRSACSPCSSATPAPASSSTPATAGRRSSSTSSPPRARSTPST